VFKNLNTDPKKKPRLLGELGDLSHTKVSSSVFTYKKSTEIFGQDAAADYIHQVIEGAVRTHKMLSMVAARSGRFTCRAISSVSKMAQLTLCSATPCSETLRQAAARANVVR